MQWQNEQVANLSSSSSLPYWFQILVLKANLNSPSSLHIAGDSFLQCFLFIKYWIQWPQEAFCNCNSYFLNNKQKQAYQKTLGLLFFFLLPVNKKIIHYRKIILEETERAF